MRPITTLSARDIYSIWAPSTSVWSQWAKPVLFAQLNPAAVRPLNLNKVIASLGMSWLSNYDTQYTGIVVNLPAVQSVAMGIALAQSGYQPVPLFNAANGPGAVIPLDEIQSAVVTGAATLQSITTREQAPPAFLIDSDRIKGAIPPSPGAFDNRWVLFPQDFPSGTFLSSRNIDQMIVVQAAPMPLQDDLKAILYRWKKANVEILGKTLNATGELPGKLNLGFRGLGGFVTWWIVSLALMRIGSRRNNVGGFGSMIPEPGSSHG
jgi:hypothetical protein